MSTSPYPPKSEVLVPSLPRAVVEVHFLHRPEGGQDCVVYRQLHELKPAIANAIDMLLNYDDDGRPLSDDRRPLGVECSKVERLERA